MPEHVHLLIFPAHDRPRAGPILSSMKQSVAKRAVRWTRDHAPGTLELMADRDTRNRVTYRFWQRGAGYDRNLWTPTHIWNAIEYIHQNPVERGLCRLPGNWRWSSASVYEGLPGPIRIDFETLPEWNARMKGL